MQIDKASASAASSAPWPAPTACATSTRRARRRSARSASSAPPKAETAPVRGPMRRPLLRRHGRGFRNHFRPWRRPRLATPYGASASRATLGSGSSLSPGRCVPSDRHGRRSIATILRNRECKERVTRFRPLRAVGPLQLRLAPWPALVSRTALAALAQGEAIPAPVRPSLTSLGHTYD